MNLRRSSPQEGPPPFPNFPRAVSEAFLRRAHAHAEKFLRRIGRRIRHGYRPVAGRIRRSILGHIEELPRDRGRQVRRAFHPVGAVGGLREMHSRTVVCDPDGSRQRRNCVRPSARQIVRDPGAQQGDGILVQHGAGQRRHLTGTARRNAREQHGVGNRTGRDDARVRVAAVVIQRAIDESGIHREIGHVGIPRAERRASGLMALRAIGLQV